MTTVKLVYVPLIAMGMFDPAAATSYSVLQTLYDAPTGKVIELGDAINFSSACYVVNVFDEIKNERAWNEWNNPVLIVCGINPAEVDNRLFFDDGCYVLNIGYSYGGILSTKWGGEDGDPSICFKLYPPGPKGGWKPED